MCFIYAIGYSVVETIVASSLPLPHGPGTLPYGPGTSPNAPSTAWFVAAFITAAFGGMFLLQSRLASRTTSPLLNRWYIHASNGFYLEKSILRIFAPLATQ